MERFFNWVGDPFVGVVLIIVAMLLSWLGSRRYRSQPKPKTRTLRTAEECIAYGVNPKYAGYYEILIEPAPTATAASIAPATPIAGAMPVPQMKFSTIADAPGSINVLIAGPKGSGKTTVLRTIITRRTGEMVALDPHNSPGKWPCAVVGGGLNWIAIDRALRAMSTNMQRRFVQLNSGEIGEGQFAQRLSVGDEFLSISQELNGRDGKAQAGKLLIERLVNGRKVGECVMVASQNDTVEALGIQGNADLKGCFDYIMFLGALVSTRAKFHGCPATIIETATRQSRVGVVWFTERNQWSVLDYDLKPVLEGVSLSTGDMPIPVWAKVPTFADISGDMADMSAHIAEPDIGISLPISLDDDDKALQPTISNEVIRTLAAAGWSRNKIAKELRGAQQARLARIAAALSNDDAEPVEESRRAMTA